MNFCYIKGGLQHTGIHEKVTLWIYSHPGVSFDVHAGRSWIGGAVFYHRVLFKDEADKIVFKLTFPDYIMS